MFSIKAAVIAVMANLLFLPLLGILGAAIATLISFSFLYISVIMYKSKLLR
jgi:O-antigen/teichoic acid export membrane protein